MAYREYTDPKGTAWRVWDVIPDVRAPISPEVRLSQRMAGGWVAFQSIREKRRLTPRPDGWDTLTDAELDALRLTADVVG